MSLSVDNAQIFRSKQLLAVAAQIGFHLMYSSGTGGNIDGTHGLPLEERLRAQAPTLTCELDGNYFSHSNFEEGLNRLRYVADRRGVAALVAGPGVGKSTLLRAFMASLGKTAFQVAYVKEKGNRLRNSRACRAGG